MFDRIFRLTENRTTFWTEIVAGTITFLTMAYIIFVQPAILSGTMFGQPTGMDAGAVTTATCLSAALATAIMGLYARYPIAQAPGMGHNFFFVFTMLPAAAAAGFANSWQVALGATFLAGVLFLLVSLLGVRTLILDAVSASMKHAIAAGIGLFIAFLGLQNAGLVVADPGTAVKLNPRFFSPDLMVFVFGLLSIAVLQARKVPGAILLGIVGATALAICLSLTLPHLPGSLTERMALADSKLMTQFKLADHAMAPPPSLSPTLFQMDLVGAVSASMIPFIFILLFMDLFDTLGTLIGVASQANLLENGKLPRANRALLSDAVGTVAGACMGTSTVTSYIESAAGVEAGGRTGLTSLTVALLFVLALFFAPLISMVGSYPPITAPALVVVGSMMMQCATKIDWSDTSEALPAFLTLIGIPLTYSIGDGLALGFILYPLVKFFCGRGAEVRWLSYALAAVLIAYFCLLRAGVGT